MTIRAGTIRQRNSGHCRRLAISLSLARVPFHKAMVTALAILFLISSVPVPSYAETAGSAYSKAVDLEARQDFEQAYNYYLEAFRLKPKNLVYRTAVLRMRVTAAAVHVHRGQQMREQGRLQEALTEFQLAVVVDPSSFAAEQEVRRTQAMIESAGKPASEVSAKPNLSALRKKVDSAAQPVELAPLSIAPITLKISEDSKAAWTMLGKLAGINVAFDPDYNGKKVSVDLKDVTLEEAFKVLSMQTKAFWHAITPNTILVATDSQGKRKEIEENVIMTFYMSDLSQPTDLTDVVSTLHTALDLSHVTPIPSQNAIIVRGTPDQIAIASKIIDDIDKARPEVVVEVMVMQVNREKIRNLGTTLPTSISASLQNNASSSGTSSSSSSGFTLNDLSHLNATNFAVTIPGASATFLASDSQSKLIQNPQIRTVDGQKASLKIGERVPVATGSFSSGVGGGGVSPLVNTQFQYLDVGVNIDITPHVFANNDVSMKISMDISSVDSTTSIGGISQPVIGQHKIEHEIRLKEGEANVIGGMLENSDTKSSSGWPWLSSVPFLKYFFAAQNSDKRDTELVFVVIPRVVRGHEWHDINTKPLDIGTSNVIELHQTPQAPAIPPVKPGAPSSSSASPQGAHPVQAQTQVASVQPMARTEGTTTDSANQPTSLSFNSSQLTATEGETFIVDVLIDGAINLFSAPIGLQYDMTKLDLRGVSNGEFLKQGSAAVALSRRDDASAGITFLSADRPPNSKGVSGNGSLFSLTFVAKSAGETKLSISRVGLKDQNNHELPSNSTGTVIRVRSKG